MWPACFSESSFVEETAKEEWMTPSFPNKEEVLILVLGFFLSIQIRYCNNQTRDRRDHALFHFGVNRLRNIAYAFVYDVKVMPAYHIRRCFLLVLSNTSWRYSKLCSNSSNLLGIDWREINNVLWPGVTGHVRKQIGHAGLQPTAT